MREAGEEKDATKKELKAAGLVPAGGRLLGVRCN